MMKSITRRIKNYVKGNLVGIICYGIIIVPGMCGIFFSSEVIEMIRYLHSLYH